MGNMAQLLIFERNLLIFNLHPPTQQDHSTSKQPIHLFILLLKDKHMSFPFKLRLLFHFSE
jgi:hypothetical protein